MFNMDMVGYEAKGGQEISLMSDYVNPKLLALTERLVHAYTDRNPISKGIHCDYPCSDHASWHNTGFRAVHVTEAGPHQTVGSGPGVANPEAERLNPAYHSSLDTIGTVNAAYLEQFSRLSVGWAIEVSFLRPRHSPSTFDISQNLGLGKARAVDEFAISALLIGAGLVTLIVVSALCLCLLGASGLSNCGPSSRTSMAYDAVPESCDSGAPHRQNIELDDMDDGGSQDDLGLYAFADLSPNGTATRSINSVIV